MTSDTVSMASRIDQVVHGLLGAIAGLGLGIYVAHQLGGVPGSVHIIVEGLLSVTGGALAYRYGPTFWKALVESVAETH